MSPSTSYDAYLSYASANLAFTEKAHRRLATAAFRFLFDKARLNPGCDWHKEIEAGCEASRVLLGLAPQWKICHIDYPDADKHRLRLLRLLRPARQR